MIVSKKMLIGAAVIPIIIALAIAIPKISPSDQTGSPAASSASSMRVDFTKEELRKVSFGVTERVGALKGETLVIDEKGQAFYDLRVEGEKGSQSRFKLDSVDLKRLKALFQDTGFMHIPESEFRAEDDADQFTRYTVHVSLDGQDKTVQWVEQSVSDEFVPPLLTRVSNTLEDIIEKYA